MKVILCGYHWTGCKALDLLLKNHEVFVYTHESPYHIPSLIEMCKKNNISYTIDNISKSILPFIPDIICSIYYRKIIKQNVIDSCNGKIFNLHPSLLPKYRGCSSIPWAIINGEKQTGFTYHYIDQGCDTGPIVLQKEVDIEEWDTQLTLYNKIMFESMKYFDQVFDLVANKISGFEQTGDITYYPRGCPNNGEINPEWEVNYIKRFIRAMYYPPYPSAKINGQEVNSFQEYLKIYMPRPFTTKSG